MKPVLRVTTVNGSVYEFTKGLTRVRRTYDPERGYPMRKNGKWLKCQKVSVVIGAPMAMVLSGVAEEGDTLRITSDVVSVEGDDDA